MRYRNGDLSTRATELRGATTRNVAWPLFADVLTLSVRHSLRNIEVIAEDSQDMGSLVGRPHALIARFLKARRVLDTAHIVILVSYTVYWCVRPSLGPSTPLKNT